MADREIDISQPSLEFIKATGCKRRLQCDKVDNIPSEEKTDVISSSSRRTVYEEEYLLRCNGIIIFLLGSIFFKEHPF